MLLELSETQDNNCTDFTLCGWPPLDYTQYRISLSIYLIALASYSNASTSISSVEIYILTILHP
jgi:hypothetical protein